MKHFALVIPCLMLVTTLAQESVVLSGSDYSMRSSVSECMRENEAILTRNSFLNSGSCGPDRFVHTSIEKYPLRLLLRA